MFLLCVVCVWAFVCVGGIQCRVAVVIVMSDVMRPSLWRYVRDR